MSEMVKSEVKQVLDLVSYQPASIVSSTLVQRTYGTVTLFAFDKDQALSEHTAPFDAIVHVLDGQIKITIDGSAYIVHAGEMIIMPKDSPHALYAETQSKMMLIMIKT